MDFLAMNFGQKIHLRGKAKNARSNTLAQTCHCDALNALLRAEAIPSSYRAKTGIVRCFYGVCIDLLICYKLVVLFKQLSTLD